MDNWETGPLVVVRPSTTDFPVYEVDTIHRLVTNLMSMTNHPPDRRFPKFDI